MPIHHVVDRVAFEVPDDLEDATAYDFVNARGDEELTIELEVPASAATPPPKVLAQAREGLSMTFPEGIGRLDESETTLDGQPAVQLDYAVRGGDQDVVGLMVVAERTSGGFVKLHLQSRDADRLRDRLRPCLDTVSLSGAPAPAAPGYERTRAGPVTLDVPAELSGPRSRVLVDADQRLRLQITVRPPDAAAPDLDGIIARDARHGWQIVDRHEQAWARGRWAHYRRQRDDDPGRERAMARAVLEIPVDVGTEYESVRHVEIHGTAEPARARTLHAALDVVLRSTKEAR